MKKRFLIVFAVLTALGASVPVAAEPALDTNKLKLSSASVLVLDASDNRPVYAKDADAVTPIASLTKLMTAIVAIDGGQPLEDAIAIDMDDFDYLKGSRSRLRMGAELSRRDMLRLALMASENRAASSLARSYPGGMPAFVAAMNNKAAALGMNRTHFVEPTGLSAQNVSTASDLAILVGAAAEYQLIRDFSTTPSHYVEVQPTGQLIGFNNTNRLVQSPGWDIQVSKTGYISEAGRCLVMMVTIASKPFVIVLLDSLGRYTRLGDAQRVKHWLETGQTLKLPTASAVPAAKVTSKAKGVKGTLPPKVAQGKGAVPAGFAQTKGPTPVKFAQNTKAAKAAKARRAA